MPRRKSFVDRRTSRTYVLVQPSLGDAAQVDASLAASTSARRTFLRVGAGDHENDRDGDPFDEELHIESSETPADVPLQSTEAAALEAAGAAYCRSDYALGDNGFPDDGYDYRQHLRETGGGVFVPAAGKDADGEGLARLRVADPELDAVLQTLEVSDAGEDKETEDGASSPFDVPEDAGECSSSEDALQDDFVQRAGARERSRPTAREPDAAKADGVAPSWRLLDEQFDALLRETYSVDGDADGGGDSSADSDDAEAPWRGRADALRDYGAVLEEFIEEYGARLHLDASPRNGGATDITDVDVVRPIGERRELVTATASERPLSPPSDTDAASDPWTCSTSPERERWDCESIVSTHSHSANLPRQIACPPGHHRRRPRDADGSPLEPRRIAPPSATDVVSQPRARGEDAETRRQRKASAKEARRHRRMQKKSNRIAFRTEHARQTAHQASLGAAKVAVHFRGAG
ncbi:hypothetical protein CDCA_CDCA08G2489 [Cyanidium caldarium]|uniref:Protein LTV1 homolog n=1 Tax=Cyanidium caldarium TaxID=2771 RepID=A0AAV9IWG7_CYACA|nr:hypothetical protein CDCA_CDCA08G2489 [Cyanidium caldarium]